MKLFQAAANCTFKAITMSFAMLSYDDSARWVIFLAVFVAIASEIDNAIEVAIKAMDKFIGYCNEKWNN